jgi:hypothetical protein
MDANLAEIETNIHSSILIHNFFRIFPEKRSTSRKSTIKI